MSEAFLFLSDEAAAEERKRGADVLGTLNNVHLHHTKTHPEDGTARQVSDTVPRQAPQDLTARLEQIYAFQTSMKHRAFHSRVCP